MDNVELAQFFLRLNTRMECLKVSKDTGWPVCRTAEGIAVPVYPKRFWGKVDIPDKVAREYTLLKPHVDKLYLQYADVLNAQIGRVVKVEKAGRLALDLTKIWGERVGLKVYASSMIFPTGRINLHVSRVGNDDIRVGGYSMGEPF